MKRSLIFLVALGLCFGAAATLMAERTLPAEKAAAMAANPDAHVATTPATRALETPIQAPRNKDIRAVGTITYDDGMVTSTPATTSLSYGNQFNTFTGNPVMASGSVTAMTFYMMSGAGTDNVFVSVYGPVGAGTTAANLTSVSVPLTAGPGAFNVHVFASPLVYTGSSFLAGVWYFGGDTVGLGSGTVAGQGHHGMSINDNPTTATGFATLPGVNALVSAGGDILPVELMTFTVQ